MLLFLYQLGTVADVLWLKSDLIGIYNLHDHSIYALSFSTGQGSNSRKRKRGGESASKTPDGTPSRSRKVYCAVTTSL